MNDHIVLPMRNQTTTDQERRAYDVLRQLCLGQDLQPNHILRKLKLNSTDADKGKGWLSIPKLANEFGLWEYSVKQIYCSFLNRGSSGARMGIAVLCITDESLCGLLRFYATQDELYSVFNFPPIWSACQNYKHRWCAS